jgi:hypothetical protein
MNGGGRFVINERFYDRRSLQLRRRNEASTQTIPRPLFENPKKKTIQVTWKLTILKVDKRTSSSKEKNTHLSQNGDLPTLSPPVPHVHSQTQSFQMTSYYLINKNLKRIKNSALGLKIIQENALRNNKKMRHPVLPILWSSADASLHSWQASNEYPPLWCTEIRWRDATSVE